MTGHRIKPLRFSSSTRAFVCGFLFATGSCLSAQVPQATQTLIDFDATWRYHDGDRDLGTAWKAPDFDDSQWASGPGILGYDTGDRRGQWPEPGLQTEVAPNLVTYYFRKEFDYTGSTRNQRLQIEQIIDDGAVYYLNGEEIGRSELIPEGEVSFATRATTATNPWAEHAALAIENAPLREGRNVLAVSVHNSARGSSDIAFAARITVEEKTEAPPALYLTWQRDPTTTMTIQWHTETDTGPARVEYGRVDEEDLREASGQSHPMVFSDRTVHTVEITGLQPDTEYRFRVKNVREDINSPFYKLRTMPASANRPIRFAVGGDVLHQRAWMEEVNRHAARFDPDFIAWGGDLAYSDGRADRVDREYLFFEIMLDTLVTADGRIIPVLMGIGNHEIIGGFYWGANRGREAYEDTDQFRESIAPFYYNLFAFPGHPGYGVLDFGEYMSLIFLDTDHSGPVEGKQTDWLAQTLQERRHIDRIFPIYHVPAYPSVRDVDGATSQRIRQHWHPLFEESSIQVAFENHDHAYKRTVPIRNEQEEEDGIVFIGDGAWGVGERRVHPADTKWYLARSQSMRHLILVTIQNDFQDFKVISREGKLIDHYIPPVRQARGPQLEAAPALLPDQGAQPEPRRVRRYPARE